MPLTRAHGVLNVPCGFPALLVLLFFIGLSAQVAAQVPEQLPSLRLGVLLDQDEGDVLALWQATDAEIRALLGSSRRIAEPVVLAGNWSVTTMRGQFEQLVADPQIDVIVCLGLLAGSILAGQERFAKPVIAFGIFDPVVQGITPMRLPTSGVKNLAFVLQNAPLAGDLAFFRETVPYSKVALLFGEELVRSLDADAARQLQEFVKDPQRALGDVETELVLVGENVDAAVERIAADVDAVYLGLFPRLDAASLSHLIAGLNRRKLPTFARDWKLLRQGAMISSATESNFQKVARRIALDLEAILDGAEAGDLPVGFDYEERLTLNWRTVRDIGYRVRWDVLTRAEIINDEFLDSGPVIDLKRILGEARTANLEIAVETLAIDSSRQDVATARSRLRPSLGLGATALRIDRDRARAALGTQAENTLNSSLRLQQLIYSEAAHANVDILDQALRASEFGRDQVALDVQLDTGLAYLDLLRIKALLSIRKQDLLLTRRNLETARLRENVGYSGRSDVYRWESRAATANQDLLDARVRYRLGGSQLNKILNKPQDASFRIAEPDTALAGLVDHYQSGFASHLTTPADLEVLVAFLAGEAWRNLPELKSLDAAIAARQRQWRSEKTVRYLPTVALQGDAGYNLARGGAGSDPILPIAPEDFTWSLALNFSLPLFQGGKIRADIAKSEIEIRRLEEQRRDLSQALELRVRAALVDLVASYFNLESSRKASEWADKSLELVQDSYAKGRVTIVQLLDVQNAALTARESAAIAVFDFVADILGLERAIGGYSLLVGPEHWQGYLNRFQDFQKNQQKRSE